MDGHYSRYFYYILSLTFHESDRFPSWILYVYILVFKSNKYRTFEVSKLRNIPNIITPWPTNKEF